MLASDANAIAAGDIAGKCHISRSNPFSDGFHFISSHLAVFLSEVSRSTLEYFGCWKDG